MKTLAALATIPGRPLERVLRSLRPQVDELVVFANGFDGVPPVSPADGGLADRLYISLPRAGNDLAKFAEAANWDGLYLACDDDLEYPPNYVATMRREVKRWGSEAFVCLGGRLYAGEPVNWVDTEDWWRWNVDQPKGAWANYAVTAALAFDASRIRLPADLTGIDGDAAIATWAQAHRVPIWVAPHRADWLTYLLPKDADTLWTRHKAEGFKARDAWMAAQPAWQLHLPSHQARVAEASRAVIAQHSDTLRKLGNG